MESTRKGFGFYLSFVLFHLGVVAGITLAFVSTVARGFLELPAVFWTMEILLIGACLVSVYRIFRRLSPNGMRQNKIRLRSRISIAVGSSRSRI